MKSSERPWSSPCAWVAGFEPVENDEARLIGGARSRRIREDLYYRIGYLRTAVERGDFREDLFYRLGVFDIQTPPLRDRVADILPLSESFLQEIGTSFCRPAAGLTREAR